MPQRQRFPLLRELARERFAERAAQSEAAPVEAAPVEAAPVAAAPVAAAEEVRRAEPVVATPTLDAAAAAAPPAVPFLQRGPAAKMEYMAGVMQEARPMLDANGVSPQVESRLAATIPQELSQNDARRGLGYTFLKEARGLNGALAKVDRTDPAAMAKATSKLSEEQRHLLASGIDLSTLPEDLSKTPAALRDQITESGIALRSQQYGEMSELMTRSKSEKLAKPDAARLSHLQGIKGLGMKYNGYDPSMGDLEGMSASRFGEIFAPGNSRFEPVQYKSLRNSYRKNLATHDAAAAAAAKDPKKDPPSDHVLAHAGIGDFLMNPDGQQQLAGSLDLLADFATSYGPGQIMGGYAASPYHIGQNKAERLPAIKDADGTARPTTLTELKASGTRMEPTVDDIRPMLGLVQMKGIELDSKPSISQWISGYNGNPNATQRAQYTNSLATNGPLYDQAKQALADGD
jgi:hypothetical protein